VFYSLYTNYKAHMMGRCQFCTTTDSFYNQSSQLMQKQTCDCCAENRHDASALLKC